MCIHTHVLVPRAAATPAPPPSRGLRGWVTAPAGLVRLDGGGSSGSSSDRDGDLAASSQPSPSPSAAGVVTGGGDQSASDVIESAPPTDLPRSALVLEEENGDGSDDDGGGSSKTPVKMIVICCSCGFVLLAMGASFLWYLRRNVRGDLRRTGTDDGEGGRTKSGLRGWGGRRKEGSGGGGGGGGGSLPGRERNKSLTPGFPRAFMPISIPSSAWATVEDGGEDSGVEAINGTNPMFFSLTREGREELTRASWWGSKAVTGESDAEPGREGGVTGGGGGGAGLGERKISGSGSDSNSDSNSNSNSDSNSDNDGGGGGGGGGGDGDGSGSSFSSVSSSSYSGSFEKEPRRTKPGDTQDQHHPDDLPSPFAKLVPPSSPPPHRRSSTSSSVAPESDAGMPRAATPRTAPPRAATPRVATPRVTTRWGVDGRVGRSSSGSGSRSGSGGCSTASADLTLEIGRLGRSPAGDRPGISPAGTPATSKRESSTLGRSPAASSRITSGSSLGTPSTGRRESSALGRSPASSSRMTSSPGTPALLEASGLDFLHSRRPHHARPMLAGDTVAAAPRFRTSASSSPSPRTFSKKQRQRQRPAQAFSGGGRSRTSSLPPTPRSQSSSRGGGRRSADRRRPAAAVGTRGSSYSPPPSRKQGRRVTQLPRSSSKSPRPGWRGEAAGLGGGRYGGAGAGRKGEWYWGISHQQQQPQEGEEEEPPDSVCGSDFAGAGASISQAADELALASIVPAVRDAAALVAGLAKLAGEETAGLGTPVGGGGDHGRYRSGGGARERERERWVRWCGCVVQTLERAGQVLGQVRERDRESRDAQRSRSSMGLGLFFGAFVRCSYLLCGLRTLLPALRPFFMRSRFSSVFNDPATVENVHGDVDTEKTG